MAYTKQLNTFHLFAGAGGGILGDLLLGHNPIGACEIESYPRDVLLARQRDGILPTFPIWDDVCTLDGKPWRGTVDVLCGGFPCQDISAAGKGAGITGERSGLWKEYARLIDEMRPRFVFAENSPLLRTRGLGVVLEDLAAMGYNARWGIIGAGAVGAPHKRDRMWVLAYRCELDESDLHSSSIKKCGVVGEEGESKGSNWEEDVASRHITGASPDQRKEAVLGLAQIPCESKSDLADTNNDGNAATEESQGTTQGSDSGQTRAQPTSEPAGLCASRTNGCVEGISEDLAYTDVSRDGASRCNPDGDWSEIIKERQDESQLESSRLREEMAYATSKGLEGLNGNSPTEQSEATRTSYAGAKGCNGFWHTDPAEMGNAEMLHAQGCADGSGQGELGRASEREAQGEADGTTEPAVGRVAHGVANRVDRLKAIGNGQVPQCAAVAFNILSEGLI